MEEAMAVHVVRLGTPRLRGEGLRLGTVRRPPRGVRREDYASRDYYDLWLPELAPSAELFSWATSEPWTDARYKAFARKYRREMQDPAVARLVALLAAFSRTANFSIGCYCEDARRCHRSLLRDLLAAAGAEVAADGP
jgi:uncharacterized protein YeaO (DUF488 family)